MPPASHVLGDRAYGAPVDLFDLEALEEPGEHAGNETDGVLLTAFSDSLRDRELQWLLVQVIEEPHSARQLAQYFAPNSGRGRRAVDRLLRVAAAAIDRERHVTYDHVPPPTVPLTSLQVALARDALMNLDQQVHQSYIRASRGDRNGQPHFGGDQPLEGARKVIRFGLGRCIRCDEGEPIARSGCTPFYCADCRHRDFERKYRERDTEAMNAALTRLATYLDIV